MHEKTLDTLGFNEIRNRLQTLTSCELATGFAKALEPETDYTSICARLKETEDGVWFITRRGTPPLSGVSDVTGALLRAGAGGILSLSDLLKIAGLLRAVRRTKQYCISVEETGEEPNRVAQMINELWEHRKLEQEIVRSILSDTEIADEASPTLFDIRRKITQAQNQIKDKLNDMIRSSQYAKALQDAVVTLRGDRYCVPVRVDNRSEISGIVHDTSSSGQTLFVEPTFVVEANNRIRELRVAEQEEIERILQNLSLQVAENGELLRKDLELISYIDFLFAKARLALDMKGVRPTVRADGKIEIIQGRNPLIDKHKVVPISLRVGYPDENNQPISALIVTGPNTGGKTVTLKTVGLFTIMMQCGLLVPCEEKSVLSVYTGIFADIGDEQSIAQNLSTFSAHMKNITNILQACDHQSLVLLDELGAGTDPTEGAALAMSILECFYQMGTTVLATTHYSELKVFASTTPGFINASCEFNVETLQPTYKLLIGIPGKSNAFSISEKLGLDPVIISRAKEFLTNEDLRFEDMITGIEKSRAEIDEKREEALRLYAEAKRKYDEIEAERDRLDAERSDILNKTKEKAREITAKARISADRMLTDIRKASMEVGRSSVKSAEDAKSAFEKETAEYLGELSTGIGREAPNHTPPDDLSIGDQVRVRSLGVTAEVLSKPDGSGKVHLSAGMMKVYLPLSDLQLIKGKKENTLHRRKGSNAGAGSLMKAATIQHELDLRGMTVEEAISLIDMQIHNGILAKQGSFTIIHGKGTGALRKGIHDYLKRCDHVSEYRLGTFGEGDTGVTIVTLS
ncbi:MAG: endonuclease MutS2 [Clostridia bacterium]|nr:endonuclease MutS2 [Clostridia bacterium]